jgi:hypothetical protein
VCEAALAAPECERVKSSLLVCSLVEAVALGALLISTADSADIVALTMQRKMCDELKWTISPSRSVRRGRTISRGVRLIEILPDC